MTGEIQSTYYKCPLVRVDGNSLLFLFCFISYGKKPRFHLQREAAGKRARFDDRAYFSAGIARLYSPCKRLNEKSRRGGRWSALT